MRDGMIDDLGDRLSGRLSERERPETETRLKSAALVLGIFLGAFLAPGALSAQDSPLKASSLQDRPQRDRPLAPVSWECLADCSRRFEVPIAMLLMVMDQEQGQVGMSMKNKNGTRDLGPMQINTLWLKSLAALGISESLVRDDGCVNLAVGAWILRGHLKRTNDFKAAVSDYHSRKKALGRKYLGNVLARAKNLNVERTLARANKPLEKEPGAAAKDKGKAALKGKPAIKPKRKAASERSKKRAG